jgi:NTE family protein
MSQKVPKAQRVLIFQGGAALGAYEAGAYRVLYDSICKQIQDNENVFDIIAGTSIGAINATIIVSHVMENKKQHPSWSRLKCWEGSAEKLKEFWNDTQTRTGVESNPLFLAGWESLGGMRKFVESWLDASVHFYSKINPYFDEQFYKRSKEYFGTQASSEAVRRYFSIPQLLLRGAHNVFSPLAFGIDNLTSPIALPKLDYKFYNNSALVPNNLWFRYTNEPLKQILKTKYIPSPISTNDADGDPRLLVIAVDVQQGKTVAFDSYPDMGTKCRICRKDFKPHNNGKSRMEANKALVQHVLHDHLGSRQGDSLHWSVYGSEKSSKYAIFYDKGVDVEHILASASVPVNYDYTVLNSIQFHYKEEEVLAKDEKDGLDEITTSSIKRFFWDGQYINNTPLREVINEHQRYWIDRIGSENLEREIFDIMVAEGKKKSHDKGILKVPDFSDVYIINLWPSKEEVEEGGVISQDRDGQLDRKNDILFHDKTEYDQKVAELVNDYIELARELIRYVPKDSETQKELKDFLQEKEGTSKSRSQKKKRTYLELLRGGFVLNKVVRIEREDDQDAISEKWADYSSGTISNLYEQGKRDTINSLNHEMMI